MAAGAAFDGRSSVAAGAPWWSGHRALGDRGGGDEVVLAAEEVKKDNGDHPCLLIPAAYKRR